jgi:hypothetical protein
MCDKTPNVTETGMQHDLGMEWSGWQLPAPAAPLGLGLSV